MQERSTGEGYDKWISQQGSGSHIVVGSLYLVSAAWLGESGKVPYALVWALGGNMSSTQPSAFVLEASVPHALPSAEQQVTGTTERLDHVEIKAGTWRTNRMLARWSEGMELGLISEVTPAIDRVTLLFLAKLPEDFFGNAGPRNRSSGAEIFRACCSVGRRQLPGKVGAFSVDNDCIQGS